MHVRPPSDHSSRGTRLDSSIDAPRPTPSIGILLANVGSPEAPTPAALRRYLAEFLGDPRIVELPRWLWLPILHGIVLRTRPRRSAALYRRIWTEYGSPLLTICRSQAEGIGRGLEARPGARAPGVAVWVKEHWETSGRPDRLLISFHGIPEGYVRSGDPYPDQCRITARH